MSRKEHILSFVNATGHGLEIGPSHNPIAPKREGFDVEIIDHCSQAELVEKYKSHGVPVENIEEVDYVWRGGGYVELTGKSSYYDWIVASHMVEHTPDLIGFLCESDKVLRNDGVLSMVVPDKRFCFDHFRPITGLAALVDAHYDQRKIHTPGRVAEYFMNVVSLSGQIAWSAAFESQIRQGKYAFVHDIEEAKSGVNAVREHQAYLDVHAWCFTPSSFRLLIEDIYLLGLSPLREKHFVDAHGEFYVALSRQGSGHGMSRMDLLKKIEDEMAESRSRA